MVLSTRPPTPPKESVEDSTKIPIGNAYLGTHGQQIFIDTPNDSPSSSAESVSGSGCRNAKRVVFSPWNSYHKLPESGSKTPLQVGFVRDLPPSRECVPLQKSILKASMADQSFDFVPTNLLVIDPNDSIPSMLQSVTNHLAGASRDSRLDSYKTLLKSFGAYDDVPDARSFAQILASLLEYIRRDISSKQHEIGVVDTELATNAVKLLSIILNTRGLVTAVPDEFGDFIIEKAIGSIEDNQVPKIMADHYMQLLAKQKLPLRIVTTERVNRLLSALSGLESRFKGNRVVGLKLLIYHRLLSQAKPSMVSRADEWLEFLVACLSSTIKDIRSRAIVLGLDAALDLGTTASVSQAFVGLLERDGPDGKKIIDSLGANLAGMVSVKDASLDVPQIWSVVILFLRGRKRPIDRWEHFKSWLVIIERSFNSSDTKTKLQANIAWNRLVSAVNLDSSTSLSMIKILRQPVASQLERKPTDKIIKHAKQLARSTYCTLLYYSFRPGAPPDQLDLFWDNFVTPIISAKPTTPRGDAEFSCLILAALFSTSQPKVWNQNRANQFSPTKPEELPCLDPKWVRLRAPKILHVLGTILDRTQWPTEDHQESPFFKAWKSFVTALSNAASKEIKISVQTMTALGHIVSFFKRRWLFISKSESEVTQGLQEFVILVNEAVERLGFRPFIEKRLVQNSAEDSFEATETPSSRTKVHRRAPRSPVVHILEFLVHDNHDVEPNAAHTTAIQALLEVALRGTKSRRSQLAILREILRELFSTASTPRGARLALWQCIAEKTASALSMSRPRNTHNDDPQYPGHEYKEATRILELGAQEFPEATLPEWTTIGDMLIRELRKDIGEAGVFLIFIEPLAGFIHKESLKTFNASWLDYATHVLQCARWPDSQQALDRANRQLWGPVAIPQKPSKLDPFDNVYSLIEILLGGAHASVDDQLRIDAAGLVAAISVLLCSCPLSFKAVCLKRLQRGLAPWIEDADGLLSQSDTGRSTILPKVKQLWSDICNAVKSLPRTDSSLLPILQDLLIAGFRSRHKAILNEAVLMWNDTFGKEDSLEYPATFRAVLNQLRSMVEIQLPGLKVAQAIEVISSPFQHLESQESDGGVEEDPERSNTTPIIRQRPRRGRIPEQVSTKQAGLVPLTDPSPKALKSSGQHKLTPRGRLRHDDSQIQFEAIDSSPLVLEETESQNLTDRQKEVRDRQKQDAAAMFPDIRSSPRTARSVARPLEFVLHKKQVNGNPLDADAEPSPTFPPGDTTMTDFLGSSPTPRSSRKGSIDHITDEVPPSSPPRFPLENNLQKQSLPVIERTTIEQLDPAQAKSSIGSDFFNSSSEQDHIISMALSDSIAHHSNVDTHHPVNVQTELDVLSDSKLNTATSKISSVKIVKNAVRHEQGVNEATFQAFGSLINGPIVNPPFQTSTHYGGDNTVGNKIGWTDFCDNNFPAEAPCTPTENQQIHEQILRDLEEASSQGKSQSQDRRSIAPIPAKPANNNRKRKRPSRDTSKPQSRSKSPASTQSFEVVVEIRKPSQIDDECIVIDDRPAAGSIVCSSPEIKQERIPSPVQSFPSISSENTDLNNKNARHRTRSVSSRQGSGLDCPNQPVIIKSQQTQLKPNATDARGAGGMRPKKRRAVEQIRKPLNGAPSAQKENLGLAAGRANLPTPFPQPCHSDDPSDDIGPTSSQIEQIKEIVLNMHDDQVIAPVAPDEPTSSVCGGDTVPNTPCDSNEQDQNVSTGHPQQTVRISGQGILERFKTLLKDVKQATFWPAEERELVGLLFETGKAVHEAGQKSRWLG